MTDDELLSERVAGGILPRVLTTFDMVAIFVAIVLFITNAAVIQSAGPAAFGWWIIAFALFLVPCAIVTGQLGVMFPGEGSIYLWTSKAFGPFWGFFAGFCAWWPGVLVMVATGTLTMSFLGLVFPALGELPVQAQGGIIVLILVLAAVLAVLRFRLTQNVVNAVFVAYGLAIVLMFAAGVVHLLRGNPPATDPWDFAAWSPSAEHGVNFANWSFFGLAVLALLGVEVPLNMGVEIRHERAVTRYLLWGSLAVMVAYLAATWGVMVSVPPDRAAGVTAVAQAVGVGLGEWAGRLVALLLAAMFFVITVVYDYSFARLIFVSGLDRRLPAVVSHVNAHKVPDVAVWIQTVLAAAFTVAAFVVVPFASATPADAQTEVYNVLQAAVTVIWCLSIVVLFVDVLIILRRYRTQFEARRLASPAVFWAASIVGALASLVGVVATLSGSWTPLISNDAGTVTLLGARVAYGTWFWLVGGIALASLAVGALLYLVGRAHARTR
ncbi:gamma-aminobutyrate permease-like transporter [Nonomuraea sp. WAC 01424]|uniref:APC family permease n=1 Tax=Nonomuraea sp. WAC 01424 TaxID=2203200 RepID=UPI000F78DEE2|nr:APC family permease [Nonomuraea sp. WAC 01424]RSN10418.1 gamma-aminobutyrate permease-like transporter [Nonomuraea sp. WAC 01424]